MSIYMLIYWFPCYIKRYNKYMNNRRNALHYKINNVLTNRSTIKYISEYETYSIKKD